MRYSSNVISNCLLAWAQDDADGIRGGVTAGVRRVRDHLDPLFSEAVDVHAAGTDALGIAMLAPSDPRLRWPLWHENERLATASLSVPVGWKRIVSAADHARGAELLGQRLLEDPDVATRLAPPAVLAVRSKRGAERLVVACDVIGVGRLYELRIGGGRVWSNRLGALPVFAGKAVGVALESWRVFAASGWFLGSMTPLADCRKVDPGARIVAERTPSGLRIEQREGDPRQALVEPRRGRLDRGDRKLAASADSAAESVRAMAAELGDAWDVPIAVSLTGGRDSRVSAAAAIAAGIEATYNTGDQVPGEVNSVLDLIAAAPSEMDHTVNPPQSDDESGENEPGLLERARDIHRVHDAMRNPQEVRRAVEIPHGPPPPPTLSGHGGELGHGFYYGRKEKLKRLRKAGAKGPISQLEKNARRKHSAATEESYRLYLGECERTLADGRAAGLDGVVLLDFFYMAQRLAYRSGLGARSSRWSACVDPAFVRGAFDLRPAERLDAKLHRMVIERLVPEWNDVRFFSQADSDADLPEINRQRIWEKEPDASEVGEILATEGSWADAYDPKRVREMWTEVRSGEGSADYEHVFDRIVWRAAFDEHVDRLRAAASA